MLFALPRPWHKNPDKLSLRRIQPRFRRRRLWPELEPLEGRTLLSTLTVTTNADSGPGSLRAEIADASSGDMIRFSKKLSGQTITLTSGELVVNKNLEIDGMG